MVLDTEGRFGVIGEVEVMHGSQSHRQMPLMGTSVEHGLTAAHVCAWDITLCFPQVFFSVLSQFLMISTAPSIN